jgi:hypothetical protein
MLLTLARVTSITVSRRYLVGVERYYYGNLQRIVMYNVFTAGFQNVDKRYLLTLIPPNFDLPQGWRLISYKNLVVGLRQWFQANQVAIDHKKYIVDYMTLVDHLTTVAEECFDPTKIRESNFWFQGDHPKLLSKIGFLQTLQKFEAMAFRDYLKQTIATVLEDIAFPVKVSNDDVAAGENYIKVWSALFNNTPCVTLEPVLAEPSVDGLRFEIQIQGQQYRRLVAGPPLREAVCLDASRLEKSRRAWECLEAQGGDRWLFGREKKHDPDGRRIFMVDGTMMRTRMRGDMCFYKPHAVYQYVDIKSDGQQNQTFLRNWSVQISNDIKLAFELLRHYKITNNH